MPIEEIIVEKQALAENYSDMGAGADFNIDPAPATKDNGNSVRKNAGLTYFTNSIILPDEIETSKTDSKLLELAFNDPNELSYEELLYVAQLASSSSKSLEILDFAFVNENRDWRAYNNAAAYAIELKDYNRAKVYLKQALMITDDNGMIENNIGIIAYRTGNFESAEKHFVAANNLGENSKHNLMVLKYAINKTSQDTDNKIDTTVEPDELIGDIIDYFPTNE
jgi:tetratricopeptide (TPR) repeat protein